MIFVGKIKNKNYNDFLTIYRSEKISPNGSAILLPFILRGWAEILDNQTAYSKELSIEFLQHSIPFTNNSRAVWVESADKKILGVICYDYKEQDKCGWIHMSFTDINERKKGINKILYKVLENDCKKLGALYLSSFVSIKNKIRLDSFTTIGMIPTQYRMYKKLNFDQS
jgi:hypothetical protein